MNNLDEATMTKTILKGTYCILIELNIDQSIEIGRKGAIEFKSGFYVYVGSALNSLGGRIKRHLLPTKKMHWHVDYLLDNPNSHIIEVFFNDDGVKHECELAAQIAEGCEGVPGFGCSDCRCQSHLFYFSSKSQAIENCLSGFEKLKLMVKTLEDLD
ncbi:MAG: hypothetical protein PWQ15_1322 [Methanobacterium sp.]|uniref:GIY-YIG nuclease family protein n=1 Tax=Methanobacterium sp. TaxID=2164 RepID=UPI0024AC2692|nr:GIY-YIG nuclease family protein [Methanobacterium sp.]MDI3550219.1 hypothetical protein [Methanobacterium sp.]